MGGFTANSPEDVLSEIRRIVAEVPEETLAALYNEWIPRLEWIIERKGKYYQTDQQKPTISSNNRDNRGSRSSGPPDV
jgi:hypothetical protein